MLISQAYAQAIDVTTQVAPIEPPSAGEAFMWNMGMVGVLVFMFYFLLIRPQQKRFKEHSQMLQALNKGDAVLTGGGLIGKVSKIKDDSDEVEVDLGNGVKVTALKSTLQQKPAAQAKLANDDKAGKGDKKKKA